MFRLPHFLDKLLTDGSEVVSLRHQPPFTPRKIPGTHSCYIYNLSPKTVYIFRVKV
jgi:hypothetical protein